MNYCQKSDMSIVYKLTEKHLTVHDAGRQKVKLAAQLLSNTTASAIRRVHALGYELRNPLNTADFIELVNNWFDIFNSKLFKAQNTATKKPFGKQLKEQEEFLVNVTNIMLNPLVPNKKAIHPFQKGIIISNNSLRQLHSYVQKKYGMSYILTHRLQQDILENFFSAIRRGGGLHDHPSPLQFKYRMRKYLLGISLSR